MGMNGDGVQPPAGGNNSDSRKQAGPAPLPPQQTQPFVQGRPYVQQQMPVQQRMPVQQQPAQQQPAM